MYVMLEGRLHYFYKHPLIISKGGLSPKPESVSLSHAFLPKYVSEMCFISGQKPAYGFSMCRKKRHHPR